MQIYQEMLHHHLAVRGTSIILTWQEESTLNFPLLPPLELLLFSLDKNTKLRTSLAKLGPIPDQESIYVQVPLSAVLDHN